MNQDIKLFNQDSIGTKWYVRKFVNRDKQNGLNKSVGGGGQGYCCGQTVTILV